MDILLLFSFCSFISNVVILYIMVQLYLRVQKFETLYKKNQVKIQNIKSISGGIASGIKDLFSGQPEVVATTKPEVVATTTKPSVSKIPSLRKRTLENTADIDNKEVKKEVEKEVEKEMDKKIETNKFKKLESLYNGVIHAKKMYDRLTIDHNKNKPE